MAWITTGHLERFANGFAEKVTEIFAKKEDIPKSLPANGGDAETVNGHTVKTDVPQGAKFTDTNTTYSAMTGASADTAGRTGLVPAPAAGKQESFLRGDGTWCELKEETDAEIDRIIAGTFS